MFFCQGTNVHLRLTYEDLNPPSPVASRSNAWVCDHYFAGIAGSKPAGGGDLCLFGLLCVVEIEPFATDRYLIQRSPTERVC